MNFIHFSVVYLILPVVLGDQPQPLKPDVISTSDSQNSSSYSLMPPLGLSPFAKQVYLLTSSNGIYDKLFNVSFSSDDVEAAFYNSNLAFGEKFGVPTTHPVFQMVTQAAKNAFSKKIKSINYFKAVTNMIHDYLKDRGILTLENSSFLANAYYKSLDDMLKSVGNVDNALSSRYVLNVGGTNFLKQYGEVSVNDAIGLVSKLATELEASVK